jgi:LacI family transcriptional regulator
VPQSIALLGFDDFELASTVRPSISVIQQPVEEMGRAPRRFFLSSCSMSTRQRTASSKQLDKSS